jgi:CHASE2 domain-containing sensor protein/tRNA A-37 threonylcarbamoyl transferase component Bud32
MKKIEKSTISDFILGITLTLITLFFFLLVWGPLESLEQDFYDLRVRMSVKPATAPLVIVAIDDASIAKLGRWPWPRAYIGSMVNLLNTSGAKVIGLDIIYSEKDLSQGLEEVRNVIRSIETASQFASGGLINELKAAEKRLDNDNILASSIVTSKKVVLPLYFILGKSTGRTASVLPEYLNNSTLGPVILEGSITAYDMVPPIPEFATGSLGLGHINIAADSDGTVRSEPLFINYEGKTFPSFSLQLALKYLNFDLKDLQLGRNLKFSGKSIPVNENNTMLISFVSGISYYSFFDVYYKNISPDAFKDKIVIIALNAAGLGTMQVTPVSAGAGSVTIIASAVDNIISDDHILRPDWASILEIIMIVLFGLYIALVIPNIKAKRSAIISLSLLLVWILTSVFLFIVFGWWIKTIHAAFLLIIGYIIIVSKRYLLVERTKNRIEADSAETNKVLGLSFQGQGLLDMAFEKFRKCPAEDDSIKELLYNLGLDFERKRMFNKAVAVYEHIAKAGNFKDIEDRIDKLTAAGDTLIFGTVGVKKDVAVLLNNTAVNPTLGRYEIIKELGSGSMGKVFLGKDPRINRDVAIKTLRYEEIDAEEIAEIKSRFFREAEAAGKLSHSNIVTIYDVGEDYDIAYMAMELLDGNDLTKYCHKENLLPLPEVIRAVSCVAAALDYAHASGVVHRDIKPANIMILHNREIKVTDFGIARVMDASKTQTGIVLGTPSYMSPEQIAGQKVDGRSDLFSLGVVLYELLSGRKPFAADNLATLMYNITSVAPVPLKEIIHDMPDKVVTIAEKLLVKDPALRYQTGKELIDDLELW